MCGFLQRRTRDPHLAEDLAQETFIKATRALLGWRGENPGAWLLAIARNVLIDHARRSRRELPLPDPEELAVPALDVAALEMLRQHDEPNLRRFDLTLARLRKASGDGLAHGYVDELITVKRLREIIEDPRVRTVRLADVTFDLDRP